ncbi:MAG: peptidylprolyl isomerase, partial [Woeseiaceae bacterium]|nr:peptidylprolyl isomerase [Woeseiaceae bacterium]
YQLPESADVAYIEVNRDMVADSIEVSEQELRELYEVSQDRYLQDEERVARHILLAVNNEDEEADKEALANDILAQLEAGESFDALAAEYSDDGGTAASGGVLGTITRSQMPGDLGAAIFSLEEGEVDGPVRSDFGFHIVRVDDILEQGPRPFEQVRAELLQELREGQVEDRFRELEQQLSDALFDHNDIDAIAEATGMEIQLIEGFTRAGGGDFADNQFVIDSIFDEAVLSGAQVTDIVEVDANRSAVFAVQNYNEATRQPLDEVRDRVVSSLRTQQADTLMSYRAEQVLAAIDAGEDFGEVAAAAGFSTAQPQIISRQDQNVDQLLMYEVFAAGKPGGDKPVYGRVRGLDGSYKVYTLDAVLPGRPEAIPVEQRDAELLRLKQQSGVGDLQAFLLYLYENADIVVNDNVVASATPFQ